MDSSTRRVGGTVPYGRVNLVRVLLALEFRTKESHGTVNSEGTASKGNGLQ